MGQSEEMAWSHHCLTAPLYFGWVPVSVNYSLKKAAVGCWNPLIRMWMQPNLLEPVTGAFHVRRCSKLGGSVMCVSTHTHYSAESEGWVPFVMSKLNSVHLLGDILENCVGGILQYHMWDFHWLWVCWASGHHVWPTWCWHLCEATDKRILCMPLVW